mmetsp:Transcript_44073/g.77356  ORF Transcript_44073/g.77356 Transcript_44073/m.77356 type:complete len:143 (+) Transcript_44073:338-766(+)
MMQVNRNTTADAAPITRVVEMPDSVGMAARVSLPMSSPSAGFLPLEGNVDVLGAVVDVLVLVALVAEVVRMELVVGEVKCFPQSSSFDGQITVMNKVAVAAPCPLLARTLYAVRLAIARAEPTRMPSDELIDSPGGRGGEML